MNTYRMFGFIPGLACALFACSSGDGSGTNTNTTTTNTTTTTTTTNTTSGQGGAGGDTGTDPTVAMVVTPDTMAAGATVTADVVVTNFVLEEPLGQGNQAGHGHYHIYLDGASGINYLVADQVPSVQFIIPANTSAGAHTLRVALGQNSHAPLVPAVEDIVDITVQ